MDKIDIIMKTVTIITGIGTIAAVIVAIFSLNADKKMRKTQGLMTHYHEVDPGTEKLMEKIRKIYNSEDEIINPNDKKYSGNKELQNAILEWFWRMEELATAINLGTYDLETYMRIEGHLATKVFAMLEKVCEHLRGPETKYMKFADCEIMINKIRMKYTKGGYDAKYLKQLKKSQRKEANRKKQKMKDKYVWYVAYGSNLFKERFMAYINGGIYKGNGRKYKGCNDKTPPLKDMPYLIPHELYFGNKSTTWGGKGVAFIDADKSGLTLGRAYLIKEEQFIEIQQQEGLEDEWYGSVVQLQEGEDNIPCRTFTSKKRNAENKPSKEYVDVILKGLFETYAEIKMLLKETESTVCCT
jgi:hypothetical protein